MAICNPKYGCEIQFSLKENAPHVSYIYIVFKKKSSKSMVRFAASVRLVDIQVSAGDFFIILYQ
jgi:hypothetical protein